MTARTAALLLVLLSAVGISHAQLRAGDPAPPITLESISNAPDGMAVPSWEDYGDRVVLLEFWGTWCGPCVAAIPHLNELAEELKGNDGVAFLSVTFEGQDVIAPFLEKLPMRAVVGHDTDKSMPKAFGVNGWPTTFLVKGGRVVYRGNPSAVSAELIAAFAAPGAEVADVAERFPIIRRDSLSVERASTNGWDANTDADTQVMVGRAPDGSSGGVARSSGSSGISVASESIALSALIAAVWQVPVFQIELDPAIDGERRHKAVFKAPNDQIDEARAFLAASLDVRVSSEHRTLDGFEVGVAEGGPTLEEPAGQARAVTTRYQPGQYAQFSGPRFSLAEFFESMRQYLNTPIRLPDELGARELRADITVPLDDPERAIEVIRESFGLVLTPAPVTIEVLRVVPRHAE